jgi:hypothetical protein
MSKLKLISIGECGLKTFPFSGTLPNALEYLWLVRNSIDFIDNQMIDQLLKIKNVALMKNPIIDKSIDYYLPEAFADDRPADGALPDDVRAFVSTWDSADLTIIGKGAP